MLVSWTMALYFRKEIPEIDQEAKKYEIWILYIETEKVWIELKKKKCVQGL